MTLQKKLLLGLAFLFLIIFGLVGVCSYYVGRLGDESTAVLKDNYNSIVYARNMLAGLDDTKTAILSTSATQGISDYYGRLFDSGRQVFEKNLKAETGNITEVHEKDYVDTLTRDYDSYVKLCQQIRNGQAAAGSDGFRSAAERLAHSINEIYDVNMQAVMRKHEVVKKDSSRFLTSMTIIGSICILVAFVYFWYFPVYVSTTLTYLAERMKRLLTGAGISAEINTKDEAFILLHGIGLLENRLGVTKPDAGT
jgi:two-component system, NtrC family, sensor histidine kinase KinB